jgi:hypothetical protein
VKFVAKLYETERDGRENLRGVRRTFDLPGCCYWPDVLVTTEPDVCADEDRSIALIKVVYEYREEYLDKRLYRRYYVRKHGDPRPS